MTSTASSRRARRAGRPPRARRRARRRVARWWRGLPRRRARLVLGVAVAVAFTLGAGSGSLVRSLTAPAPDAGERTTLGPIGIVLPTELGPWTPIPEDRREVVRDGPALGGLAVRDVWGTTAPGAVVITVVEAETEEGLDAVAGPFDDERQVRWDGGAPHLSGRSTAAGQCELVLAVEDQTGGLILLSISGPSEAFASGALEEAFRTSRLLD